MVKYAVKIHFDGSSADCKKKARPLSFGYPDEKFEWWKKRLELLEKYVLPSLTRQTFTDFDIWGLFCQRTARLSQTMVETFQKWGCGISYEGVAPILDQYADKCDTLVLIHLDSDDMYAPEALESIVAQPIRPGMVMYFENGYIYALETEQLFEYVTGIHGPPPYFAKTYTGKALKAKGARRRYVKRFRLDCVHHQLKRCPVKATLPDGNFCGLLHDSNVTRSLENKNLKKRLGDEITDEKEKAAILKRFGIC